MAWRKLISEACMIFGSLVVCAPLAHASVDGLPKTGVPELDPGMAASAVALLASGLAIVRGRRARGG